MKYEALNEEQEEALGRELVRVLQLKEAKDGRKSYNPPRYATTHGAKTALGIARTVHGIMEKGGTW